MGIRVDVRVHGSCADELEDLVLVVPAGSTIGQFLELVQARASLATPAQQLRLDRAGEPGPLLHGDDKAEEVLRDGDVIHAIVALKRLKTEVKTEHIKREPIEDSAKRAQNSESIEIDLADSDDDAGTTLPSSGVNPEFASCPNAESSNTEVGEKVEVRFSTLLPSLEAFTVHVGTDSPMPALREAVSAHMRNALPDLATNTRVSLFTERHPLPVLSVEKEAATKISTLWSSSAANSEQRKCELFAHLIPQIGDDQSQEPASSHDGDGRLAAFVDCPAWHPVRIQQSVAGMNCFLSSLCVLGKEFPTKALLQRRVLGHFRALCQFPPAVATLQSILAGRLRQLTADDKAVLSHAWFALSRRCVPSAVPDDRVFEHSRVVFSMLINRCKEADSANELWRTVPLPANDPEDPESTWLEDMERECTGDADVLGRAWFQRQIKWLRASRNGCREVSIWIGARCETAEVQRSCCFPWQALCAEAGRQEASMLKVVSALTLRNAAAFALTLGSDGRIAVFTGMPPCSAGEVLLFSPSSGRELPIDPHLLARSVRQHGADVDAQDADARTIGEAVIVCLDTSYSMSGSAGFPDDKGEDPAVDSDLDSDDGDAVAQNGWDEELPSDESAAALELALKRWRSHPNFQDFRDALRKWRLQGSLRQPQWAHEEKALQVLREVLKVEHLRHAKDKKPDVVEFIRIASHNRDAFTSALLSGLDDDDDSGVDAQTPAHFLCAITHSVMSDPVVAMDGFTYERNAILDWFRFEPGQSVRSPMTGAVMLSADIRPNQNLRTQIVEWKDRQRNSSMPTGNSFTVFCRGPWPETISIRIWPEATAADVRRQVANRQGGIPEYLQVVRYKFQIVPENVALVSLGLQRDETINIQIDGTLIGTSASSRGGGQVVVTLRMYHAEGEVLRVAAKASDTMETLMFRLWSQNPNAFDPPAEVTLWSGLESVGDGCRRGQIVKYDENLLQYEEESAHRGTGSFTRRVKFELHRYRYKNKRQRKQAKTMTRLDCVKTLFETFVHRIKAYNFATDVGLVLFNNQPRLTCKPSAYIEDFRDEVSRAASMGDTALYDAINMAADSLESWLASRRPGMQASEETPLLRIYVLSDGEDTKSSLKPWRLARRLQSSKITLDAVHIGDCSMDTNLHCLAKCTGGYVFKPTSMRNALLTHELEVVLFGPERPASVKSLPAVRSEMDFLRFGSTHYPVDRVDESTVPVRRQPAQLSRRAVSLESACQNLTGAESGAAESEPTARSVEKPETPSAQSGAQSSARQRRLLREMRAIMRSPHPNFDVYPCESDIGFWRLVLSMDQSSDVFTPYGGGCWLLYVLFPAEYPERPPELRFVTQIRHCNVNAHGRICHSILDRNYTTDTAVSDILNSVYALVLTPDADDAVDTTLAFQCHEDPDSYRQAISQHVQRHAVARDRAAWGQALEEVTEEIAEKIDVSALTPASTMGQLREFIAAHALPIITAGRGRTARAVLQDILRHVSSRGPPDSGRT